VLSEGDFLMIKKLRYGWVKRIHCSFSCQIGKTNIVLLRIREVKKGEGKG
jgi:hypothetical protein